MDPKTVAHLRQTVVEDGWAVALHGRSTRKRRRRRVDGYARWFLRLLADQAVELGIAEAPISHELLRARAHRWPAR